MYIYIGLAVTGICIYVFRKPLARVTQALHEIASVYNDSYAIDEEGDHTD